MSNETEFSSLKKLLLETDFEACTVTVSNQTPCDWGVTIVGIVAEWTYEAGNKSSQALPNAYLGCNQSTNLVSRTECVKLTRVVMRIKIDGEDGERLMEEKRAAPPNACSITANVVIKPKAYIAAEKYGKRSGRDKEIEIAIY